MKDLLAAQSDVMKYYLLIFISTFSKTETASSTSAFDITRGGTNLMTLCPAPINSKPFFWHSGNLQPLTCAPSPVPICSRENSLKLCGVP